MRSRPLPSALGALAVGLIALYPVTHHDDGGDSAVAQGSRSGDLLAALRELPLPRIDLKPKPRKAAGPHFAIAQVRPGKGVKIRELPGGRLLARAGDRSEFGSVRTFWVARRHRGWLGVPAPELPNNRLGWIRNDPSRLQLFRTRYWIVADTSARLLELRYGNRVLDRFPVTVGSPGSPTPPGDYSITDGLAGRGVGPYYGCCILALSGHQPHLPPNWLGGDRIAIHGTPFAVGGATSAGCLRTTDRDIVALFARVPLGTPVFIRS
jgi:L,D-transpeptidase catalytic domain